MILNLVNKEESQIKYELISYPDGQADIRLDISTIRFEGIEIKSRFRNFSDLEVIICSCKALNNMGIPGQAITLEINYLLGARSDIKFVEGGTSYLRDVIAPILNSLNLSVIKVMDVHSIIADGVINNLFNISNRKLVEFAINDVYGLDGASETEDIKKAHENMVIISPDAGAMKKIYSLIRSLDYSGELICASKHRDIQTGSILSTEVPIESNLITKDLFILDDICDGGRTFIEIAKRLTDLTKIFGSSKPKVYLIVTHGIFSQGLKHLSEYFDCIYTTNSYREINSMNEFGMHNERYLHKIKQLDIWK